MTEDRPTWPQPTREPTEPRRGGVPGWLKGAGLFVAGAVVGFPFFTGVAGYDLNADPQAASPRPTRTVVERVTVTEPATTVTEAAGELVPDQAAREAQGRQWVRGPTGNEYCQIPASTPTPPPAASFTDGQYLVGPELPPGIYRTDGQSPTGMCYVAQLDGLGGEVVDNDIGEGPRSFNFATEGAVAEFSGGCVWTRAP